MYRKNTNHLLSDMAITQDDIFYEVSPFKPTARVRAIFVGTNADFRTQTIFKAICKTVLRHLTMTGNWNQPRAESVLHVCIFRDNGFGMAGAVFIDMLHRFIYAINNFDG